MMVESSAGDDGSTNVWDDACFNAMFSGVSLQSFLAGGNQNHCPLLLPSLFGGGYISDALTFPDASTSLYPQPSSNFVAESIESSEPMNVYEQTAFVFHASTSFPHLPDLRSLGQCSSSFNKRARVDSVWNPLQMVEPMMRECEVSSSAAVSRTVQIPRSALARQRRQKLSDKTRCLQKLLPWDKKMDISTMLEGAFKYVKFLQAQLLALQSMPCESAISTNSNHHISGVFGGLERLSRNQLLQVLVNSPVAQTMLCSQSCCVFSAEQLGLIQKIAEKRVLLQQISTFRHKP
ncbi:Transcription factor bHLH, partial [Cucurbita argyrosperma subsp. argyrosperma]|uniref:Transcription factor bHLH117-like isoform X1 n=1 Tax=Cucurbita moschata TaxID=3662 RepID=A0A6J1EXY4_CUCMO